MAASLLKMQMPWGEFQIYLDELGYPWFREADICRNFGIPTYDALPRWVRKEYLAESWCYEREVYRHFEMITADLSEDWFWYTDFLWYVAKRLGIEDFAQFMEKKFDDSLERFLEE